MSTSANMPRIWIVGALVAVAMAMPSGAAAAVQLPPATALAAGGDHACAVVNGGAVQCWGWPWDGELGNGALIDGTNPLPTMPVAVSDIADATAVSAGDRHVCALRAGGTVSCWGYDGDGELGDGAHDNQAAPVAVAGLNDATAVSAGEGHTCAVRSGGALACWGYNSNGQLGDATHSDRATPTAVRGLSDVTAVSAGGALSTCALRANRTVACWGTNHYGELGNGSRRTSASPVAVRGLADAVAISSGADHTCALRAGGGVACWGYNGLGQLGNGTIRDSTVPVAVRGLGDAVAIATGDEHSCAVRATGAIVCWGYNGDGQLGVATKPTATAPVAVPGIAGATAVTAGYDHTCALLAGGAATCWGSNESAQFGDGTTTSSPAPKTGRAKLGFFDNIPNIIMKGAHTSVRPSTAILFADGQWVLDDLVWRGWGTKVARANGLSSSSNDIPAAGPGRRINTPARLTLTHPTRINGHRVYRCFRMAVPPPASQLHGCLKRQVGGWLYSR
jgi:alpha-tubulin suppressor-like RCC1 family protein